MAKSVYEIVTDRLIEDMEKGQIPWIRPWHTAGEKAINRVTGKAYRGINKFLLPYSGEYATFKQIQDAHGKVNKGEHGFPVVFWKQTVIKQTNAKTGEEEEAVIPVLRYYTVFHIKTQTDLEEKHPQETLERDNDPIEDAENILHTYLDRENIAFDDTGSGEAYYIPSADKIVLPNIKQFANANLYYGTAFHEATHSTGHESRLKRLDKKASFGTKVYSKEELVAEIGSAMMMSHLGIETEMSHLDNVAYLQSWIKVLRGDSKLIVSASSKAEKAVNFILGIKEEKECIEQ